MILYILEHLLFVDFIKSIITASISMMKVIAKLDR